MPAYCTLAEFRQRVSGDAPVLSGAYDQTLIDAIDEVSTLIDNEVRLVRGQPQGWSFLPPSLYGVQQVSISGSPTGGSFTLTFGASTTGNLLPGTDAPTLQAALDGILGAGNSTVTGAPGGPWTVTLAGALSGPQATLIPASALMPAPTHAVVQALSVGSTDTVTRRYTGMAGGSDLILIDDSVAVTGVRLLTPTGGLSQTLTAGIDYVYSPFNTLPIIGLQLTRRGWWPWFPGAVEVDMTPGYALTLPPDVRVAALQEVDRSWRAFQAGNDDRLGVTPFGQVVVSKALLASTIRMCNRYSYGGATLRMTG